jgi:hypothetical protein
LRHPPPGSASWRLVQSFRAEEEMRAEIEAVVDDIRESLSLLRRHL